MYINLYAQIKLTNTCVYCKFLRNHPLIMCKVKKYQCIWTIWQRKICYF